MKKTYIAKGYTYFDITVKTEDGNHIDVCLINGKVGQLNIPAKYSTSDPLIQKAIEANPVFKEKIITLKEGKVVPEVVKEEKDEKVQYGIFTAQEAKEWLKENKGATNAEVKNIAAIDIFCEKHDIGFPDWER
jgi:hypothetical protein